MPFVKGHKHQPRPPKPPNALTPLQSVSVLEVPPLYRHTLEAAFDGKHAKCGIRAKCVSCVNYEDVFKRVWECTIEICPLWPYRPYQKKAGAK